MKSAVLSSFANHVRQFRLQSVINTKPMLSPVANSFFFSYNFSPSPPIILNLLSEKYAAYAVLWESKKYISKENTRGLNYD